MQVIINISEEDYEIMKHNVETYNPLCPLNQEDTVTMIANGTPLPEGHGDLIDRDELEPDTEWDNYYDGFTSYSEMQIRNADTIIEAENSEDIEYGL